MPIDIHTEQLCTLSQAARLLPRLNANHISPNAIWRWCRRGVGGVHLEHVRIGGRIFTSAEALNRFANLLAARDLERLRPPVEPKPPAAPRPRRTRRRARTDEEDERRRAEVRAELEREGL